MIENTTEQYLNELNRLHTLMNEKEMKLSLICKNKYEFAQINKQIECALKEIYELERKFISLHCS